MSHLLAGRRAVGAFSVANLEMLQGVVLAAEECGVPVILQIAEGRLGTAPLHMIGPAMLAAARESSLPLAVHLDHGRTLACIEQALDLGFTSVMYDGSHLPLEENIRMTRRVRDLARAKGADVEAEIGSIGRTEEGQAAPAVCADPEECVRFAAETGVDALAVAIGNAHGVYAGAPELRFDILEALQGRMPVPMVLHGGTGISAGDFQRCIALGMRKINIATACFQAAAYAGREAAPGDIFDMSRRMIQATRAATVEHIRIFEEGRT